MTGEGSREMGEGQAQSDSQQVLCGNRTGKQAGREAWDPQI